MLEVQEIHTYYDVSHVLFGVSLHAEPGEILCLLGRNGVGKTTTLRSIMGLTPIQSGSIKFLGQETSKKPPFAIARLGVGYVPEGRRIFPGITVRQNMEVNPGFDPSTIGWIYDLFPDLKRLGHLLGGSLSGGQQQMLAIARALVGKPKLLLMDEPTQGISPVLVGSLKESLLELARKGIAIVLAESNAKFALAVGQRCCILNKGEKCYDGTCAEVRDDKEVTRTYLGV